MRGRLITFEGIEGSGKTVVSTEVSRSLESAGVRVTRVREPGGTAISEAIRALLLDPSRREMDSKTELFLYLASRAQLVRDVIRPALEEGRTVVCDRYLDASVAYQGWARGLGEDFVATLNAAAIDGAVPDRTFLLDVAVADGLSRGPAKREADGVAIRDRLEREDAGFHQKVRDGYLRLAKRERKRIVVIDASRPLDEVVRTILGNLEGIFRVRLTA
jgi:dTMP kinase